MSSKRELIAGLALIGLINAVVLAGVAWNRQPPTDSRLQLSERELGHAYSYWGADNNSLALRLNYRWPSRDDGHAVSINAEQMAELGFTVPPELNEESVRRYRRQVNRDALLVLELNGPAYQREVALRGAAHSEALRLQQAVPDSEALADAAERTAQALAHEQQRSSRLLVVAVGLDKQKLRARYPDRQRYAVVRAIVTAQGNMTASDGAAEGDASLPQTQRWSWQVGGSADAPGLQRLNLPKQWHTTFTNLERQNTPAGSEYSGYPKQFVADVAFGRLLEPWVVALRAR